LNCNLKGEHSKALDHTLLADVAAKKANDLIQVFVVNFIMSWTYYYLGMFKESGRLSDHGR